jgi:glucan phosphoethanolaminetransferase (alkaline phosphatase superfamily)
MLSFVISAVFSVCHMLFNVVLQMAPLAKGGKVFKTVVCFVVVNMGNSKHYLTTRYRVWLVVLCAAPLTLIACPGKPDKPAYKRPFGMIL